MAKKKKKKVMKTFVESKLEETETFITDDGKRMPIYIITPDGEKRVHLDYVKQEMAFDLYSWWQERLHTTFG